MFVYNKSKRTIDNDLNYSSFNKLQNPKVNFPTFINNTEISNTRNKEKGELDLSQSLWGEPKIQNFKS